MVDRWTEEGLGSEDGHGQQNYSFQPCSFAHWYCGEWPCLLIRFETAGAWVADVLRKTARDYLVGLTWVVDGGARRERREESSVGGNAVD